MLKLEERQVEKVANRQCGFLGDQSNVVSGYLWAKFTFPRPAEELG